MYLCGFLFPCLLCQQLRVLAHKYKHINMRGCGCARLAAGHRKRRRRCFLCFIHFIHLLNCSNVTTMQVYMKNNLHIHSCGLWYHDTFWIILWSRQPINKWICIVTDYSSECTRARAQHNIVVFDARHRRIGIGSAGKGHAKAITTVLCVRVCMQCNHFEFSASTSNDGSWKLVYVHRLIAMNAICLHFQRTASVV